MRKPGRMRQAFGKGCALRSTKGEEEPLPGKFSERFTDHVRKFTERRRMTARQPRAMNC